MRISRRNALGCVAALVAVLALAFAPAVNPSSCPAGEASGKTPRAPEAAPSAPRRSLSSLAAHAEDGPSPQPEATAAAAAAVPARTPAPAAPGEGVREQPAAGAETPAAGPVVPSLPEADPPEAARIDPVLTAPTGLSGAYDPKAPGNRNNTLSWTRASPDTGVLNYLVVEWDDADLASMSAIFDTLAVYEPSAAAAADDFDTHAAQVWQSGLTYTQRLEIVALIAGDLDTLFGIISASTQPDVWALWDDLLALRTALLDGGIVNPKDNVYVRRQLGLDNYYFYVVLASYTGGNTSPPTNTWSMFAYWDTAPAPAQPAGFTATAYDPGVALEWSPNSELYLAGYNVYVAGSTTPLNGSELITHGTEYFHMTGAAGATYYVEAVNIEGLKSTQASAVSILAAAVIYGPDHPAWQYTGTWAREDYSGLDPGGRVLRVERTAGNRASVAFSGRRVRVYSARYWRCGTVSYYIYDGYGVLEYSGAYDLYYDGGYYTGEHGTGTYMPPLWSQMTLEVTGLSKGQHTLVIEDAGIAGAGGDTFVDFDYAESR